MKRTKALIFFIVLFIGQNAVAQNSENWTSKQLMEPAVLASVLSSGKNIPHIFSVGPGAIIPHSVDIGMTNTDENVSKLKKDLKDLDKKTSIVIYCGCCPFEHCPNVRPAISLLNEMKFTNYKLLNLPHNIKTDWISKGYPTVK